jgi:hypothetical protein
MTERFKRWVMFGVVTVWVTTAGCSDSSDSGPNGGPLQTAPGSQAGSLNGSNKVPVVESVRMKPAKPAPGRRVQMSATVTDANGDATIVRYVWKTARGQILGEGRIFNTVGLEAGERLQVVVTASDGQGESEPYIHKFSLSEPSVEVGFVAIDASKGTTPGSIFGAVVESTDENRRDYDVVVEWIVGNRVVGRDVRLDTTDLSPGDVVELRAQFDLGDRKTRFVSARSVSLARGNAPEIVSQPLAGIEGGVFRYQIRAKSAAPGVRFSYELLEGPEGMKVESTSGLVSWRPRAEQRGGFKIEVAAHDQWGSGAAQSFKIVVNGADSAPASAR